MARASCSLSYRWGAIRTSHLSIKFSQDSVESPEKDGRLSKLGATLAMICVWNGLAVGMLVEGMLRGGRVWVE